MAEIHLHPAELHADRAFRLISDHLFRAEASHQWQSKR
jgi:hypothetical protein